MGNRFETGRGCSADLVAANRKRPWGFLDDVYGVRGIWVLCTGSTGERESQLIGQTVLFEPSRPYFFATEMACMRLLTFNLR